MSIALRLFLSHSSIDTFYLLLVKGYLNLCITAGAGRVNCRNYLCNVPLDDAPTALTQDHESNFAAGEVLLIPEIAVGSHHHFKPGSFSGSEKFTIGQFFPA